MQSAHLLPLAGLAIFWLLLIVVTNPLGNFPLNDDWNYGLTVKALLAEHRLIITEWSLAASITHVLIGALACLPFGFSFLTLRISTMCLGYLAGCGTYCLGMRVGAGRAVSILAAALLLSSPLFFNLALTFMTDVPFLALGAVALLVLSHALDAQEPRQNASVAAAAVCAALCVMRQTGLVIPIAFAVCYIAPRRRRFTDWLAGLAPFLVSVAAVIAFQLWLGREGHQLYAYRVETAYLQEKFSQGFFFNALSFGRNLIVACLYLGLLLLPLMPIAYPALLGALDKKQRWLSVAVALEVALLLGACLALTGAVMPLADNVFYDIGLGPLLLGLTEKAAPVWPRASHGAMLALTGVAACGAGLLVSILATILIQRRSGKEVFNSAGARSVVSLCALSALLYLIVILIRGFFDRYLLLPMLFILPILCAVCSLQRTANGATSTVSSRLIAALALALPLCWFAVAGTHDYLSWNRARWAALDELTNKDAVSALDIDGGLEFNGWYGYDPRYRDKGITFSTSMRHGDVYGVSLNAVPGYDEVRRYKFDRWLPPGQGDIIVLKKHSVPLSRP